MVTPVLILAILGMSALEVGFADEDWKNDANRHVIGGSISHFGIGLSNRPDVALYMAKMMAVSAIADECGGIVHKETKIYKTDVVATNKQHFEGYARASIEFQLCEEGKTLRLTNRKEIENELMRKGVDTWKRVLASSSTAQRAPSSEKSFQDTKAKFASTRDIICRLKRDQAVTLPIVVQFLGTADKEITKDYAVRSPVYVRVYDGIELRFNSETEVLETIKGAKCNE